MPAPFCWAAWFGHGRPPTPYFSQPFVPEGLSGRPSVTRKGRHTASLSRARGLPNKTPSHKPPYRAPLQLFHLCVIELDGGRTAEDRDRDLEPGPFLVDVLDGAVERGKGAVGHLDLLADLEADGGLGPLDAFLDLLEDPAGFGFRDGDRLAAAATAQEAGDLGDVLDQVPGLVIEIHLHQHVAGKELALGLDLGAA